MEPDVSWIVGRDAELAVLDALGRDQDERGRVIYLYGPAGVGKSTLVRAFARSKQEARIPVALVDGEHLDPSPDAFLAEVGGTTAEGAAGHALERLEEADFEVDERRFGMYGHDWRVQPPMAWLEALAEREISADAAYPEPVPSSPLLVLSEADFREAVREALRRFHRAESLADNPLLRSRIIVDRVSAGADTEARVSALRAALNEVATPLLETARSSKVQRALHHTYFQPAASQELAAEAAGMPFSTYRRHLRDGVQQITDRLWRQELGEG